MKTAPKGINVVGVVPVTGREDRLGCVLPDCLHPLSFGVTALQRSIAECAYVGCSSIWVICDDQHSPIIRETTGDYVVDPIIYENWEYKRIPDLSKKHIPIFYSPILQKDVNRRDTLGWSVLHGSLTSFIVSKKISKWVAPSSYYVSFPYGIYHPKALKAARAKIRAGKRVYGSHEGKTVRDGLYLPFTFDASDWLAFRRQVNKHDTGGDKNLPLEERWSAKNFTLDKIFKHDKITIEHEIEIDKYYNLDSWEDLRRYYASDLIIKKMTKSMSKPFFLRKEET